MLINTQKMQRDKEKKQCNKKLEQATNSNLSPFIVTTLALGLRPRQGLEKV
jgi:hypothetical protein